MRILSKVAVVLSALFSEMRVKRGGDLCRGVMVEALIIQQVFLSPPSLQTDTVCDEC